MAGDTNSPRCAQLDCRLAARILGPTALNTALTRLTELNAIKADTSRRWDRTVGHPGMAARTARLATALPQASATPPDR